MDRRTLIKNLALVIGGAALLPSCLHEKGKASIKLKHLDINSDQEKLIADISETIIPKTSTPGAKDLNLHLFVLKMIDDCSTKKDQQAFLVGLGQFNDLIQKRYNQAFSDCTVKQREEILNELGKKDNSYTPELNTFFSSVKGLTIFGYTNSKYFMTKEIVYELIPGRYNAYYPVKNLKAGVKNG